VEISKGTDAGLSPLPVGFCDLSTALLDMPLLATFLFFDFIQLLSGIYLSPFIYSSEDTS
jgi:hypothetical protein